MMSLDDDFDAAVQFMNASKHLRVSDDQKLQMYGCFKQATMGDNSSKRPGLLDFVARAKWDAWTECKGLSSEDAKFRYISIVDAIAPSWREGGVGGGASAEQSSQGQSQGDGWVSVSMMAGAEGDPNAAPWAVSEQLHQAAANGDIDAVMSVLERGGCDVNALDNDGSTALHYAADRGFVDIAGALIAHGAAVNIADADGQTPLMLAAICEQADVARVLLDAGAELPQGTDVDDDVRQFVESL